MESCCKFVTGNESEETSMNCSSGDSTPKSNDQQGRKFQKLNEDECKEMPTNDADDCTSVKEKKRSLKRWTAEEDSKLLEYFYRFGNDWDEIAANMPGRAVSGVKNRFYWICKGTLPPHTVQKIKSAYMVKKLYKAPDNSSELFRKINKYIQEECIFESFLALDRPAPYTDLVYKLKMTPQDLENHAKMQMLMEKAQQLYKNCEDAKQNLVVLQRNGFSPALNV